jgi:hypothetical protein
VLAQTTLVKRSSQLAMLLERWFSGAAAGVRALKGQSKVTTAPKATWEKATWGHLERIPKNFSVGPFGLCDCHGYSASYLRGRNVLSVPRFPSRGFPIDPLLGPALLREQAALGFFSNVRVNSCEPSGRPL